MNACHEPISWLRLERFHLGDLPPEEHDLVKRHLDDCPCCRAMLGEITDDGRTLPPLPLPTPSTTQPWYRRLSILLPAVAGPVLVAALALFTLLPPTGSPGLPAQRVAYKGGELALDLVRDRDGAQQQSPESYRDGDRFTVLLTSPPGEAPWDLVVLQAEHAFFPLAAGSTPGGNRTPVGTFQLTGPGDVAICVMVGEGRVARAILSAQGASALADGAACVTLEQSPGGRP